MTAPESGRPTLVALRKRVAELASDEGEFSLVCGRTGERPVPIAGKRFDDRADAREAIRVAELYRLTLRQYDPQVPYHDLIARQATERPKRPRERATRTEG